MGKVSDYVLDLVRARLRETGPVVWFDSDRTYESLVSCLEAEDIPVFRYTDSFLRLRHEVEPHMAGLEPPRIVIYVPLNESETHDALVELTAAGATLRPGHPSYPCNTRLSVVARSALKDTMPAASLDGIIAKVDDGKLSLGELDVLAERGAPDLSTLSIVYGSTQPDEIALMFLSDRTTDESLIAKAGVPELRSLFADEYGANLGDSDELDVLRMRLSTQLLANDCALTIQGADAAGFDGASALSDAQGAAVRRLAAAWRNSHDLTDSYLEFASQVEAASDLAQLPKSVEALRETETFALTEETLQRAVCEEVRTEATPELVDLARTRQRTYWGRQPGPNDRWQLIVAASELLLECRRVSFELGAVSEANEMVQRYTEGDKPWCDLDTTQRRLEFFYLAFDDIAAFPEIERLASKARQEYHQTANELCERFVGSLEGNNFELAAHSQRETFAREVRPALEQGKVAYFMVDALRFEMGRELARLLETEGDVSIAGAIASVPTITEIGMPSLLPKAEGSAEIVDIGGGKLALKIDGVVLRNRKERMDFLIDRSGVPSIVLKLENFQPFKKATRESIHAAQLVVVTSQEIDMVGEFDNPVFARQTMGQVLDMIVRAIRALTREGVEHFVIASDHGYLFGDEALGDMKIESPKGDVADLHRRVWVGHGGAAVPNTIRFKPASFQILGELDIVTPRTLACFKAGGGSAFFHGGVSLQELVIPVVVMRAKTPEAPVGKIVWSLGGAKRITTRVYTVSVAGEARGLFDLEPQRVRVELKTRRKTIGRLQDADYGVDAESRDILLRLTSDGRKLEENHLTFILDDLGDANELQVVLLDARTDQVLRKMEHIEVALSL